MKAENKLIAEFMGYKFYNNLPQQRNGYQLPKHKGTAIYLAYEESELQYNTSWDWLMPVVDKIYNIGLDEQENNKIGDITNALVDVNKEKLHNAVVDFINEYNKNK